MYIQLLLSTYEYMQCQHELVKKVYLLSYNIQNLKVTLSTKTERDGQTDTGKTDSETQARQTDLDLPTLMIKTTHQETERET